MVIDSIAFPFRHGIHEDDQHRSNSLTSGSASFLPAALVRFRQLHSLASSFAALAQKHDFAVRHFVPLVDLLWDKLLSFPYRPLW